MSAVEKIEMEQIGRRVLIVEPMKERKDAERGPLMRQGRD